MLRHLRIAVSIASGICCLLVIALWARSYWRWDSCGYRLSPSRGVVVNSFAGTAVVTLFNHGNGIWTYESRNLADREPAVLHKAPSSGVGLVTDTGGTSVFVPHWLLALLLALGCGIPWMSYRFSLRTLLAFTTLIALLLGIIIYT